ncbi:MAG: CS domain-containing protein [Candidatus Hadarchaeaceae archaeon]
MADTFEDFFRRMMKRFIKDFEQIERAFGPGPAPRHKEWEVKPPGSYVRGGGFSISISSNGQGPPKIEVRRFGSTGRWEKVPLEKGKMTLPLEKLGDAHVHAGTERKEPAVRLKERIIPEYNVSVDFDEVTITLCAEGVESEDNVRLKFYPESVEVYALSPKFNREYFCTVALPASTERQSPRIKVQKNKVVISIPRRIRVV